MTVMGTHSSYQLGCLYRTEGYKVVVTLLEVSEREEGVVALRLPIGPVTRCEPSTILTPNSQSVFHAGVSLYIHSFIRTQYLPVR